MFSIPFNIPYVSGSEKQYVLEAIEGRRLSGDGPFTLKCQAFFEKRFGFPKTFLTTSCSDALEMAALLMDLKEGDEVILPSFTFVSTANAFILRGAKLVFADSLSSCPNIDPDEIEKRITPKTKAIVIMHYAGIACEMDAIMALVKKHNLFLVEDAALALDASYKGKALGSFGHFATFSFHETKNISCGEGGLLVINDERFVKRAEIIREKGTNRSAFFRGETDKYSWVDIGSSFLPSDLLAAYLWAQLEAMDEIQSKRLALFDLYYKDLSALHDQKKIRLAPKEAGKRTNASLFYFTVGSDKERDALIAHLKANGIQSAFHYQSLHKSAFFSKKHSLSLPNAEKFSDHLLRLPLYAGLREEQAEQIVDCVRDHFS